MSLDRCVIRLSACPSSRSTSVADRCVKQRRKPYGIPSESSKPRASSFATDMGAPSQFVHCQKNKFANTRQKLTRKSQKEKLKVRAMAAFTHVIDPKGRTLLNEPVIHGEAELIGTSTWGPANPLDFDSGPIVDPDPCDEDESEDPPFCACCCLVVGPGSDSPRQRCGRTRIGEAGQVPPLRRGSAESRTQRIRTPWLWLISLSLLSCVTSGLGPQSDDC